MDVRVLRLAASSALGLWAARESSLILLAQELTANENERRTGLLF